MKNHKKCKWSPFLKTIVQMQAGTAHTSQAWKAIPWMFPQVRGDKSVAVLGISCTNGDWCNQLRSAMHCLHWCIVATFSANLLCELHPVHWVVQVTWTVQLINAPHWTLTAVFLAMVVDVTSCTPWWIHCLPLLCIRPPLTLQFFAWTPVTPCKKPSFPSKKIHF